MAPAWEAGVAPVLWTAVGVVETATGVLVPVASFDPVERISVFGSAANIVTAAASDMTLSSETRKAFSRTGYSFFSPFFS